MGRAFQAGTYRKVAIPGISAPVENLWQALNALVWAAGISRDLARRAAMVEIARTTFAETLKDCNISLN